MTLYAHVTGTTVDAVGQPPSIVFDTGRWWDIRPLTVDVLTPRGWYVVTETPRPADTGTTTHDESVRLVDGQPVQWWTPRPWTTEELAARIEATNADALRAKATTALTANATFLGIGAPSTAQNTAQLKALTRQVQALIRLEVRALADAAGT